MIVTVFGCVYTSIPWRVIPTEMQALFFTVIFRSIWTENKHKQMHTKSSVSPNRSYMRNPLFLLSFSSTARYNQQISSNISLLDPNFHLDQKRRCIAWLFIYSPTYFRSVLSFCWETRLLPLSALSHRPLAAAKAFDPVQDAKMKKHLPSCYGKKCNRFQKGFLWKSWAKNKIYLYDIAQNTGGNFSDGCVGPGGAARCQENPRCSWTLAPDLSHFDNSFASLRWTSKPTFIFSHCSSRSLQDRGVYWKVLYLESCCREHSGTLIYFIYLFA